MVIVKKKKGDGKQKKRKMLEYRKNMMFKYDV